MPKEEIPPPWKMHPGYHPGDCFWRQSGEIWFVYVWRPYWESLSDSEKEDYLAKWNVPFEWQTFYFDNNFQEWLESTDD